MDKKLVFTPSAYRDWTVIYCQFAWMDWVSEFKKQFGWSISDICFVYNGDNTILYRVPEEHLISLYEKMSEFAREDNNFFFKIASSLETEALESEKFYKNLEKTNLDSLTLVELGKVFKDFQEHTVGPAPKLLVSIYLPQAVDFMGKKLEEEEFAEGLKELMRVRDKTDHIIAPLGNGFAEKIAQTVLKKIDLKPMHGRFLSIEELLNLIEEGNDLKAEDIKKLESELEMRAKYFLVADGKVHQTPLKDYLENRNWSLEEFDLEEKEVRGTVAYKTDRSVRGVARVVLNKSQLNKVQEGDILVAPMTTPEYAPVFGKIKAIITDEGGVTSHAAIVAREMKIPAIIGTKIASKKITDGNLVEIDTDSGVVRIIK